MTLVTLTTDFGTQDGYVGAMKGRILSLAPSATILDLTHEIAPQDLIQAAFCIKRSLTYFSRDTIHVMVVDPGVGSLREGLVVQTKCGLLVAPDNGILSLFLAETRPQQIRRIRKETLLWKAHSSFDGLAVFAPVAAHLAQGMSLDQIGDIVEAIQPLALPEPDIQTSHIEGEILLFDRFGNAITNIPSAQLQAKEFSVHCQRHSLPFQCHYSTESEQPHPAIAIMNSDHLLELAVYCGSIEEEFQLKRGMKVRVEFKT
ncbi:SAM-dependent chlorinase/fluorinase [Deltaproteobacteria bacterium TL4]